MTFIRSNYYLPTVLFLLITLTAQAQFDFERNDNIVVNADGRQLDHPWLGGLNNPQFNTEDLDNDGKDDLIVFNRSSTDDGDKLLTFLNKGTTGQISYEYAPQYEAWFPPVQHWVLFRDYNCDGVKDIFCSDPGQMIVYTGSRDGNGVLSYELTDTLLYNAPTGDREIFVSAIDIPAVDDINGDGDLDVLTFSQFGLVVDYFENQSVENGGGCGLDKFELVTECWGEFVETGVTEDLILDSCGVLKTDPTPDQDMGSNRHPGSTLMTFDEDGDGDKELILGDISFQHLNRTRNDGTPSNAHIYEQDITFPSYDTYYELTVFPGAYYEDINNDGKKDLLASPSSPKKSENVNVSWLYLDVSATDTVFFQFETDSFLVDQSIDLGEGAYPAFFDYNADGLLDLVVGNYGYFVSTNDYQSGLALFENVGTATQPAFKLIDRDWLNISSLLVNNINIRGVAPAFGDIDQDNDIDLIIGDQSGQLHLYTNTAGVGNPASFTLTGAEYENIDVGNASTPFFYDVNKDGLLDLLIGRSTGNVRYYQNVGTTGNPQFGAQPSNFSFGLVDVGTTLGLDAYSTPVVASLDGGNTQYLISGNREGKLQVYVYDETKVDSGAFWKQFESYANIEVGERSSLAVADLTGNGKLEMVVGNYRGGLSFYQQNNNIFSSVSLIEPEQPASMVIYPNPANEGLTLSYDGLQPGSSTVTVFSIAGQAVMIENHNVAATKDQLQLNIQHLQPGMYFVQMRQGNTVLTRKLVVD